MPDNVIANNGGTPVTFNTDEIAGGITDTDATATAANEVRALISFI